jgi:VanZ family protein
LVRWLAETWQKPWGLVLDVLPAPLYLAALFWGGLAPLKSLPGPQFEWVDKVWHLGAFAGLAVLSSRAMRHFGRSPALAARDSMLLAVALGGLLEVFQSLTPYRSADIWDWIADTIGAVLAYGILRGLELPRKPLSGTA